MHALPFLRELISHSHLALSYSKCTATVICVFTPEKLITLHTYKTIKMTAIVVALLSGQKKTQFPLLNFLGLYLIPYLSLISCDVHVCISGVAMFAVRSSWLEINKCTFTFSSKIRQIQCTRTEFWCVQCPRPAGPSALDKHQIQASALDLSYVTSKSKCKFINPIHTRQKNKIICLCSWQIVNKMVLKCH